MSKISTILSTIALTVCTIGFSVNSTIAQTTIEVAYSYGSAKARYTMLVNEFSKSHPDIKIVLRAADANYHESYLKVVREALTGNTPDVLAVGMNLLPDLVEKMKVRDQISELTPLLEAEPKEWTAANYSESILSLGRINGHQWAMPVNASTPIAYYNADFLKNAGISRDNLPKTWDEFIEAAVKIEVANKGVDGIGINLTDSDDDWFWQSMVDSFGGKMLSADRSKVAFGDELGLKAAKTVRRLVKEAKMPWIDEVQARTQLAAGKMGIVLSSTGGVAKIGRAVGDKFELVTGPFPMGSSAGRLPIAGNAAVILTKDPAKLKAAWEFVKFITSARGQEIVVLASGYMPTNKLAASSEYLGKFYKENPNWTTSLKQWPVATQWIGYPNSKSVKVWKAQSKILFEIGHGKITPADGLRKMVESTDKIVKE